MKHLPGPYELKDSRIEGRNELHGQSTGVVILATLERHRSGSTDHVCPDDIQIATGRLFVAAPALAEACRPFAADRVPSLGGPKPHGDGNAYVAVTLEEHAALRAALALLEE